MKSKAEPTPNPDNVAGILLDPAGGRQIIVTRDILLNQIDHEGPRIAGQVLSSHRADMLEVSDLYARAHLLSLAGFLKATREGNDLFMTITSLVHNAGGSVAAAACLVCQGFRLQPVVVLRNCVENLGVAAHLFTKQDDLPRFCAGDLDSPKAISSLKKLVPPMGALYGLYSQCFAHIGPLYARVQLPKSHLVDDDAFNFSMSALRVGTWSFYVVAELLSVAYVGNGAADYWRRAQEGTYAYDPSPATREAMGRFLGRGIDLTQFVDAGERREAP